MDNLDTKQFIMMMRQIAEEKNLPFEVVQEALEQALAAAWRKDFGDKDQEVRTELNIKTGAYKLWATKVVTKEVTDPQLEVSLEEAKTIKPKAKVGDEIEVEVKAKSFGRVAAQTAKQVILQKLREAERDVIYSEYSEQIGQLLNGTVQRVEPRVTYVDLGRAQAILPASEQIPGEQFRNGQRLKAILRDVEVSPRGPQLILTRASAQFVALLFEREVPEMENKAVEIKTIAREAGARTKLAVVSTVPGVDPVGTFVGGHGTRVQAVMNEVGEEKIDIIMYSDDPKTLIANALSPTKINHISLDEKSQTAVVTVPDDQQSIAIGKGGQNVRLASKLTGWQIDIKPQTGEDNPKPAPAHTTATKKKIASKQDLEEALLATVSETHQEGKSEAAATETKVDAKAAPPDEEPEGQK